MMTDWEHKQLLQRVEYCKPVYETAFKRVCNPLDWKAPVDASIHPGIRKVVADAIMFFTATEARFTELPGGLLRVQADGYRRGPAGDN